MAQQLSYEDWTAAVNRLIEVKYGLTMEEAIDWPQRDSYDDGLSPEEAFDVWEEWQLD